MADTEATREKLAADFNALIADSQKLLRDLAAAGDEKAQVLRGDLEQKLREAREGLERIEKKVVDGSREAAKQADEYVRANPWQSVGIAAAVGALVGIVLGLLLNRD